MSARLPLIAAQPGIWMAEALSTLPNAWSVAHYVELKGNIDGDLLALHARCGLDIQLHHGADGAPLVADRHQTHEGFVVRVLDGVRRYLDLLDQLAFVGI